jgi:hypothetical protein
MPKKDPARLTKVSASLPFGIGTMEWEADPTERRAAWELYVELVTRVAVQSLETEQHGLLREALNSLYSLFAITRDILRKAGPDVGVTQDSLGGLAIAVLNRGLRPFMSKWHPLLQAWEAQRPPEMSPYEHEQHWTRSPEMRAELNTLRSELETYAHALAIIAGVQE